MHRPARMMFQVAALLAGAGLVVAARADDGEGAPAAPEAAQVNAGGAGTADGAVDVAARDAPAKGSKENPYTLGEACGAEPGPVPPKPSCQRYTSSRVVRGGKVQVVQTPVESCIGDPGWSRVDAWSSRREARAACIKLICDKPANGGQRWIHCGTGGIRALAALPGMVAVPAGTFKMGSSDGRDDERPEHSVAVGAFQLDRTEVTVAAYAACLKAGGCTQPGTGYKCNWGEESRASHPINCVDWNQATAYCAAAGKRLPTEQEWEYAARGTDGRTYPWGSGAPYREACWYRSDGTCPVGAFLAGASPYGALDMAGNVWEWTSSGYSANYGKNRSNDTRVSRGGSWGLRDASDLRAAIRGGDKPAHRDDFLGFRCAR